MIFLYWTLWINMNISKIERKRSIVISFHTYKLIISFSYGPKFLFSCYLRTFCWALQGIMDLPLRWCSFMLIWIDKLLNHSFLGTSVANDFDPFLLKLKFMNFIQRGKLLTCLFFTIVDSENKIFKRISDKPRTLPHRYIVSNITQ